MDVTPHRASDHPPAAGETSTGGPTYVLSRWLFLRLLGLVYLIAFVSLALQVTGLVGEHGILPATAFLERTRALYGGAAYRLFPTVCWLGAGDGTLRLLCWGGGALALLVMAGVAQAPALALLWACYLSLSVVGQTFLWFQWDGLLLETGLLALLYAPTRWLPRRERERAPSGVIRWLVWLLLFKLMFLSGITKLVSGDPTWRHLTALDYHFWTQPLPPWTAWYAQQLPGRVHQGMTLGMFAIELGAPWLIFAPRRFPGLRVAACVLLVLGQLGIALTGNYGFFNLLAIVLCLALLDDATLRRVLPLRLAAGEAEPLWWRRVMATERPEIVIEGSVDSVHWREYEFRWKPGGVTRRPGFVAPHQPRLDWQMWFAALDPEGGGPWLAGLVRGLLEGRPAVLSLLGANPFHDGAPRYVRLAYYRYRFTTRAERSRTGAWWSRELTGYLTRPVSFADLSRHQR